MPHLYPRKKKLALTAQEFEAILGCVQHSANSQCGEDWDELQALHQKLIDQAHRFRSLAESHQS